MLITQIGSLADRIGRRAVLLGATLMTPVFVTALTFAPTTFTLLVARTLGFTAAGVQSPVTGTLVLEESPPRLRGLFTGVLQIGFPLGFFLASLMVPFIYETWGWRFIFLLSLLFLPYAWVIWRYLRDSRAWQRSRDARARTVRRRQPYGNCSSLHTAADYPALPRHVSVRVCLRRHDHADALFS